MHDRPLHKRLLVGVAAIGMLFSASVALSPRAQSEYTQTSATHNLLLMQTENPAQKAIPPVYIPQTNAPKALGFTPR